MSNSTVTVCKNCNKPKPICVKCTKLITFARLSCSVCRSNNINTYLHPGCSAHYLSYLNANSCCLLKLRVCDDLESNAGYCVCKIDIIPAVSSATLRSSRQLLNFTNISIMTNNSSTSTVLSSLNNSSTANSINSRRSLLNMSSANSDQSLNPETMLSDISHEVKKIDELADILKKFMEQQSAINANINSKFDQHKALCDVISLKLDGIPELVRQVRDHDKDISQLKTDVQNIAQTLTTLPAAQSAIIQTAVAQSPSADVVISGIPKTIEMTDREIAALIFESLGVSHLIDDILDVRPLMKRQSALRSPVGSQSSQNRVETISFIVSLKSPQVRDHVLKKKRDKRDLSLNDVFNNGSSKRIYVKELLPSDVYRRLLLTKTRAASAGYKYVWSRAGTICVRKMDGSPVIYINSDHDLAKLE